MMCINKQHDCNEIYKYVLFNVPLQIFPDSFDHSHVLQIATFLRLTSIYKNIIEARITIFYGYDGKVPCASFLIKGGDILKVIKNHPNNEPNNLNYDLYNSHVWTGRGIKLVLLYKGSWNDIQDTFKHW